LAIEAVLILSVLLFGAAALFGALHVTRQARLDHERRVALVAKPLAAPGAAVGSWLKGRATGFDARLQRIFVGSAVSTWGVTLGTVPIALFALIGAAAGWALTNTLFGIPYWLAAPFAVLIGYGLPRHFLMRQQRRADTEFTDLFPDAVDAIARMMRAGLPISSAVRAVSTEAPAPVNAVFAMVADQMSLGAPIEEALDASSRHIGLPDFRFFTVAVVLQHLTGGNLAATLEIMSDIIRKRRAMRMKAKATTAEIRVAGYVLGALPFLIIVALLLIQPGYLTPLFTDPRGHIILLFAAAGLGAGGLTMRQMMRSVTAV
jgi:tight adherence protein B